MDSSLVNGHWSLVLVLNFELLRFAILDLFRISALKGRDFEFSFHHSSFKGQKKFQSPLVGVKPFMISSFASCTFSFQSPLVGVKHCVSKLGLTGRTWFQSPLVGVKPKNNRF